MRRLLAAAVGALLLAGACSDDSATPTTTTAAAPTTADPSSPPVTTASDVGEGDLGAIALETKELAQIDEVIALAPRPSSPDLFLATKDGTIRLIKVTKNATTGKVTSQLQTTPLLDIGDDVIDKGEQGLLGAAFSSDGRILYLDYTADPDGHTVIVSYELGDRDAIDKKSRRELLTVDQPFANHNGGNLVTGPDGYLYVSFGDGGSGGDPDDRAQDKKDLLGKILRIDPEGGTEDGPPYAIPAGNPFADDDDAKPEIWLYGVRNPWRFSFDRETGDLWIGDVGQEKWEEVDVLSSVNGFDAGKGADLGWPGMEASHGFKADQNPAGATLPIFEYSHDTGGCAIVGGFVYRGTAIPGLVGTYVYADNCQPGLHLLQVKDGKVLGQRHLGIDIQGILSLGEDRDGELYALADGKVLQLVAPGTADDATDDDSSSGQ